MLLHGGGVNLACVISSIESGAVGDLLLAWRPLADGLNAVRKVGRRYGLTGSWLNAQVTPYLSRTLDTEATLVFGHPDLVVTVASPARLREVGLLALWR